MAASVAVAVYVLTYSDGGGIIIYPFWWHTLYRTRDIETEEIRLAICICAPNKNSVAY